MAFSANKASTMRRSSTSSFSASSNPNGNKNDNDSEDRKRGIGKKSSSSTIDVDDEDDNGALYSDDGEFPFLEVRGATLSGIDPSILVGMEAEGMSVEDMAAALEIEYGVVASIGAVRDRLFKDRQEQAARRKKTGKTRRDKYKERQLQRFGKKEETVTWPSANSNLIQVQELATLLEIGNGQIIGHLMMNEGLMVNVNQNIDREVATRVAEAFGKKMIDAAMSNKLAAAQENDENEEDDEDDILRVRRAPVVAVMGHVDHGKTTLLDRIRDTRVAQSEAGGITQVMSAFQVNTKQQKQQQSSGNKKGLSTSKDKKKKGKESKEKDSQDQVVDQIHEQDVDGVITFIDTPGHAAFSDMRKRGASVTDIVVLVVAADDGVMEQTKECINAAKAAGCPLVVAINKIDKEGADLDRVKLDLLNAGVVLEEFGGEVQTAQVSAKTGQGIEDLLEKILLQADVMNLRASNSIPAEGTVIEAKVDRGLGLVVTGILQEGKISRGQYVVAGSAYGKVRRLLDDKGKSMSEALPAVPFSIVGLTGMPSAGEKILYASDEDNAREIAELRSRFSKEKVSSQTQSQIFAAASFISNEVGAGIAGAAGAENVNRKVVKIPVVIKAEAQGSLEAIVSYLSTLTAEDESVLVKPDIVFTGIGDVSTSDVDIAAASKAQIIAFNIGSQPAAKESARSSNVEIESFNVFYDLVDFMAKEFAQILSPPLPGIRLGAAKVKKVFKLGKIGKIAGCEVVEGSILADTSIRVLRNKSEIIFTGKISSLKMVKEDAKEVLLGSECGIAVQGFEDYMEDDLLECFRPNNSDTNGSSSSSSYDEGS